MLQMHGHRPRFLRWLFQFTHSPKIISGCLGVLGPAGVSDHWSLPMGAVCDPIRQKTAALYIERGRKQYIKCGSFLVL